MNLIERFIKAWKQSFSFSGRSTRTDYWVFFISLLLLIFVFAILDGMLGFITPDGTPVLATTVQLLSIPASVSIAVRRLHDMDYRGWCIFLPLVVIPLLFSRGTVTENRFGENPRNI